ncbi:hypothetical protein LguiA_014859 [Lonicera macranthoides]
MGEAQEQQVHIMVQESKEASSFEEANVNHQSTTPQLKQYKWWIQMAIFSIFVLSGQSAATLLGRLYYNEGGKSKWMVTLIQPAGFPILLPFLLASRTKNRNSQNSQTSQRLSTLTLISLYLFLGLSLTGDAWLYSVGLRYLPVSTFSLICASQLGFNALFSFFLNSLKFTPFILNSLVLLTISTIILVFQNETSSSKNAPHGKYVIGFLSTVGAAAGYAFILSVTQLSFKKILKRESFKEVIDVIFYESFVATCATLVGLFASGEWKSLRKEMEEFGLGKTSYVVTLIWTALAWQVFAIGLVGLIFRVSSLFANVISTLSLPIVPVLAVVVFDDKMSGVKVIAMLFAIWGFASYIYQHYLDDLKSKNQSGGIVRSENLNEFSQIPLVERG